MSAAESVQWEVPTPPNDVAARRERQQAVRRTDWRFLLPPPDQGAYEHLVMLGGAPALAAQVLELGIARRVSTGVPAERSADGVIRLHDSPVDVRTAASCLRPGGVLYAEVDRHLPHGRTVTPARVRRELRGAGLTPLGVYWVRTSFLDHGVYLPADAPAAVRWYFADAHRGFAPGWRERMARGFYRVAAALGPFAIDRVMRCFVVTAVSGDGAGAALPSILGVAGVPDRMRGAALRPVVLAPRLRRVALIPFADGQRRPVGVLKVARLPDDNFRTANEQHALSALAGRLDARMRRTVPAPFGVYCWGQLLVGAESYVGGRVLAHPHHPWRRVAARTHHRQLRTVAAWLSEFHRQTRVRWRGWDDAAVSELEATLDDYARAFGLTADERRLFAAARAAARSLVGIPIPIVWRHCDLGPSNAFRASRSIAVVDWEAGQEGLPLLDLLFFLEEWLQSSPVGPREFEGRVRRFHRVFVQADAGDAATREVHGAIGRYLAHVGLPAPFCPLFHVLLWSGQAVWRSQHARDLNQDAAARSFEARYVGCVRALAAGTSKLFGDDPSSTSDLAGGRDV